MANQHGRDLRSSKMPDFLGVGAQRSGTSWLYKNLGQHPQIWLPPIKELHYFSSKEKSQKRKTNIVKNAFRVRVRDSLRDIFSLNSAVLDDFSWDFRYFFGKRDLAWYYSLFRAASNQISGEITPEYSTLTTKKIRDIKTLNPKLKIIYLMRDPIDRSWSSTIKDLARNRRRTIDTVPDDEVFNKLSRTGTMLRSNHLCVLEKYESVFNHEQVFIGFFEDVIERPQKLLKDICRFLGVSTAQEHNSSDIKKKVNSSGKYRSPIPTRFHVYLARQQIDQLRKLNKRFGGPATNWLKSAEEILAKAKG